VTNLGKTRRLQRLARYRDGRYLFVPMDHSVSDGPSELVTRFGQIASAVAGAGVDAIVAHKGRMELLVSSSHVEGCALIVHLSAGTSFGLDPDSKVVVGTVAEAARLGADAVSVHVNLGARSEPEQLRALGDVATQCDAHGMPLLVMIYVRGPQIADQTDAKALAHAVNVAADLGADLVKTALPRPVAGVQRILDSCSRPVIFSGGSDKQTDDLLAIADLVISCGGAGFAIGRRAWTQPNPAEVVSALTAIVHPGQRPAAGVGVGGQLLATSPEVLK
jgi:2-amino-4,5-dihydroxy-6-oxo-7-(phosphooxy)heptanoate synthase